MIADDDPLVRAALCAMLDAQGDIEVVADAADGNEAVARAARVHPDVILMDVRMPDLDGIEATRRIVDSEPDRCRIVMLTTFDLDEYVFAALAAGASGFLLKDVGPERLIAAVRLVAVGDALLAPSITRRLVERYAATRPSEHPAVADLTAREIEVLTLVAGGHSNAEIADQLYLGEATVKTHVSRVLQKLELRDRVQAVVFAYEHGLVEPGSRPPA